MRIRISSRKSDLARLQVYRVVDELKKLYPNIHLDLNFRESLGDKNLTDPLWKLPEKGVFTEDFYRDLIDGHTDAVVHSWKDLPTEGKPETEIVATLARADQRDLLLFKKSSLSKLTQGEKLSIYSSSPRRAYNLEPFFRHHLPGHPQKIEFLSVRGNIQTRVKKMFEASEIDGLVVAKAAIDRLLEAGDIDLQETKSLIREHLNKCDWMVLPLSHNPNAAAQGAIAIEILKSNTAARNIFSKINTPDDYNSVVAERTILSAYGGGCHQKIGVAVLHRPYGQVTFLKGLTEAGQILSERKIQINKSLFKFDEKEIFSSSSLNDYFTRTQIPYKLTNCEAILVAKADAWPNDLTRKTNQIIWAAGTQTWKALAKRGIWVNGCQDSLGETEPVNIDTLFGKSMRWTKLTHKETKATTNHQLVPTYQLEQLKALPVLVDYKCFFWTSGYYFQKAIAEYPEILKACHSCGPGNTYNVIAKVLAEHNLSIDIGVFLDQESWRRQVLSKK